MLDEHMMGTTKLGARGQIVLPKDIRKAWGLRTGDPILIVAFRKGDDLMVRLMRPGHILRMMDHLKEAESAIRTLAGEEGRRKGRGKGKGKGSKRKKRTR